MIRSSLRLYQASRLLTPLVNRNLPALCSPADFARQKLNLRSKATVVASKQVEEKKPSFFMRIAKKLYDNSRSKYTALGVLLYDKCANEPSFLDFVNVLGLPDTFHTWFLVTELHIWMVMTKCTVVEDKGRHIRNAIVKTLWDDGLTRMKRIQPSGTNAVIQDYNQQLRAALFAYDEGILSSDTVLANALWRRFYTSDAEFEPEKLEILVSYVRRQIVEVHKISDEDFCRKPTFKWLPLKP